MTGRNVFLLVSFLLAEAVLLKLGFWQYHRMHERQAERAAYFATIDKRLTTVTGVFDTSREAVWESQDSPKGESGYRILTPLVNHATHTEVIVDRGWIERSFEPGFLAAYAPPAGEVSVTGLMKTPPTRHGWLKGPTEGRGAAHVIQFLDLSHIPPLAGVKRLPTYLQARSATNPHVQAFLVVPVGGDQNQQYMYTWFGLALMLVILSLQAFFKPQD